MNAIINLGHFEKESSTFKFPWSRVRVHLEPEFIPKQKQHADMILGMYFCQIYMLRLNRQVTGVRLHSDDSNKNADIIMTTEGKKGNSIILPRNHPSGPPIEAEWS